MPTVITSPQNCARSGAGHGAGEKRVDQQRVAVAELEKAGSLETAGRTWGRFNQLPVLSNSIDPFSWASLTPAVEKDIEISQ